MQGQGSDASRTPWLLLAGAGLGIALAAAGIVVGVGDPTALPRDAIAAVDGVAIPADLYARTVDGLARDKRNPLTDQDRAHVLQRLIEEELLVQRGVEIGLVSSAPRVRKAIVAAMIESIVADVESREPSPDELRAFFEENAAYFTGGPRIQVERMVFRAGEDGTPEALARARSARVMLSREPAEAVRERLADAPVLEVPGVPLPVHKLREYLGPTLVEQAQALEPGVWSDPLETPRGAVLLRVVERTEPVTPAYESVAPQVEAEFRRREGDAALRGYLEGLRAEADVALAADAPR